MYSKNQFKNILFTITVLGYLHQPGARSDSKLIAELIFFLLNTMSHRLFYIGRCPICFMQNIKQTGPMVLEKKSFEWFLPYMDMTTILNFVSWPI